MSSVAYPVPTPIFHITAIDNLGSIAREGALLSKQIVEVQGTVNAGIAYDHIQGRRAMRVVPAGSGATLHHYVPFYFAPRSPMLMAVNGGNVPGCPYRQDDVVHLVSTAQAIDRLAQPYVFSDIHAVLGYAQFFENLAMLGAIDWSIFFEKPQLAGYCQFWGNRSSPARHLRRKESRQAEFLVLDRVPLAAIAAIGVRTVQSEARVRQALTGTGWAPSIRIMPGWYY